jgi:hypothetical protein
VVNQANDRPANLIAGEAGNQIREFLGRAQQSETRESGSAAPNQIRF